MEKQFNGGNETTRLVKKSAEFLEQAARQLRSQDELCYIEFHGFGFMIF
jgi:hypothetical protein